MIQEGTRSSSIAIRHTVPTRITKCTEFGQLATISAHTGLLCISYLVCYLCVMLCVIYKLRNKLPSSCLSWQSVMSCSPCYCTVNLIDMFCLSKINDDDDIWVVRGICTAVSVKHSACATPTAIVGSRRSTKANVDGATTGGVEEDRKNVVLPTSGTAIDVEGTISATINWNTLSDSSIVIPVYACARLRSKQNWYLHKPGSRHCHLANRTLYYPSIHVYFIQKSIVKI